jgi:hypothetical protein
MAPGKPRSLVDDNNAPGPLATPGARFIGSSGALVASVLVLTLAGSFLGEKIQVGHGLGWDGQLYGSWARDFHGHIVERGVSRYYIQRILPSALIHYSLRLLSIPRTDPNIIRAFGLLNVALLTLAAFVWCRLADSTGVSRRGKWLGGVCLFVNFAVLKWVPYYPVLTDVSALTLGMLMLYCYLTDRGWALGVLTAVGAFTWPALIYQGSFLLLFPRDRRTDTTPSPPSFPLNTLLAGMAALLVFGFLFFLLLTGDSVWRSILVDAAGRFIPGVLQPLSLLAGLSAGCVAAYLFFALRALWDRADFFRPSYWWASLSVKRALATLVLLVAIDRTAAWASTPGPFGTLEFWLLFSWESMRLPGIFYLGHVVFFGPLFLLVLLRWRSICRGLQPHGLGLTLCFTFNLLLSLDPQSRHLLHFLPLLVLFAVKSVESEGWGTSRVAAFTLLAVAFSKVWLHFGGIDGPPGQFPAQWFFMNLGDWMTLRPYFAQGGSALVAGLLMLLLFPRGSCGGPMETVPGRLESQPGRWLGKSGGLLEVAAADDI